jgi:putative transposase
LGWTREGRIVDANAIKEPERPCRGLDRLQDKRLTLPSNGDGVSFQLKPLLVLRYLSRYVFRTAISNARILGMDQTHVTFRWKDRGAEAWRTERLPGVEFLRRFLQHVLLRGFHRVRYHGLWHPSKRELSNRAWVLLICWGSV